MMNTSRPLRTLERLLSNSGATLSIWLLAGIMFAIPKWGTAGNNFLIFRNSFFHLVNEQNLYASYPLEYAGRFIYGPLFCVLMAPFALLPKSADFLLYLVFSACILYLAIQSLPVEKSLRNGICLLCLIDFVNNQQHFQTNALVTALILLSFAYIVREKDILAAGFISLGFFTKVYGLAGLAFFLFSRHKWLLLISVVCWSIIFYFLPILFSSSQFVGDSYGQWIGALMEKNRLNAGLGGFQDISVIGLIRRLIQNPNLSEISIQITGCLILFLPFLRFSCYRDSRYRILALSSILMFIVLFSTASENPTYIILQCGVGVWFCAGSSLPVKIKTVLLLLVLVFSSLTPTDLYPAGFRDFYVDYSLRAVPCMLLWLIVIYEMGHGHADKKGAGHLAQGTGRAVGAKPSCGRVFR